MAKQWINKKTTHQYTRQESIISTVSAWVPDKKGSCSGALMMGFGASALVVGNLASVLIKGPGWRLAYLAVGIALGVILTVAAVVLRLPDANAKLPRAEAKNAKGNEGFEVKDLNTAQMLRRPSFWQAFFCIVCLSAVGNTVISFAHDLALSVGANVAFATSLVGCSACATAWAALPRAHCSISWAKKDHGVCQCPHHCRSGRYVDSSADPFAAPGCDRPLRHGLLLLPFTGPNISH